MLRIILILVALALPFPSPGLAQVLLKNEGAVAVMVRVDGVPVEQVAAGGILRLARLSPGEHLVEGESSDGLYHWSGTIKAEPEQKVVRLTPVLRYETLVHAAAAGRVRLTYTDRSIYTGVCTGDAPFAGGEITVATPVRIERCPGYKFTGVYVLNQGRLYWAPLIYLAPMPF